MSRLEQAVPGRRGTAFRRAGAGLGGLAAVAMILAGCAPASTDPQPGASTSEGAASAHASSSATAGQQPSGASSTSSSSAPSGPSSATSSEDRSGKGSRSAPGKARPPGGPGAKPTLEPRPRADLSDKQIPKVYSDNVAPGRQVTATLCNLDRGHLEVLEEHIDGDDGNLRLALISLGDLLDVWEGLTWDFPDAADDIDTARDVYAAWELALALRESGDSAGAQEQLDEASRAIDRLPADPEVERGCGS